VLIAGAALGTEAPLGMDEPLRKAEPAFEVP
jgi:hypothetical protein